MSDEAGDLSLFGELYLKGDRFKGGRLPVDALIEVQRFQQLVLAAAREAWLKDHPDEDLPANFDDDFQLTIRKVEPGSALLLLERPSSQEAEEGDRPEQLESGPEASVNQPEVVADEPEVRVPLRRKRFDPYYNKGRDVVLQQLEQLFDKGTPVEDVTLLSNDALQNWGATLRSGESLRVAVDDVETDETIPAITPEVRAVELAERVKQFDKLERRRKRKITIDSNETVERTIAGRLVTLGAQDRKFSFQTLIHGQITGSYDNDELTEDLKRALNSTAKAQVVRLRGDVHYKLGRPVGIKRLRAVQQFEVDGSPWSRRFIELASLDEDWGGEAPGAPEIDFVAIDAAWLLLVKFENAGLSRPGIFPTTDGGVLLEWSSPRRVMSIEVTPDADFELFDLPEGSNSSVQSVTNALDEAFEFARGILA